MKLTKSSIASLPPPIHKDQMIYWDDDLPGFGLRVTKANARAWVVQLRLQGRSIRRTLAKVNVYTPELARQQAKKILSQAQLGLNPFGKPTVVILQQAVSDYLSARQAHLKPTTMKDYQRVMRSYFADWLGDNISLISQPMILDRHRQLMQKHGPAQANLAMRYLSAILQWASYLYEDDSGQPLLSRNPVRVLSVLKRWYPVERRQRIVSMNDLATWYAAVMQLRSQRHSDNRETMRDCLLLMLFTGLRDSEVKGLQWRYVDFREKTLMIPDPKNRQPHVLPLSDYVESLLWQRYQVRQSEYVFASTRYAGPIVNMSKSIQQVQRTCQVSFTAHDLRRTFVTIAEQLGFSVYLLKRLLNHKPGRDVTAGYIMFEVERLRQPLQAIADFIVARVKD